MKIFTDVRSISSEGDIIEERKKLLYDLDEGCVQILTSTGSIIQIHESNGNLKMKGENGTLCIKDSSIEGFNFFVQKEKSTLEEENEELWEHYQNSFQTLPISDPAEIIDELNTVDMEES
jgi:hypothetical protein